MNPRLPFFPYSHANGNFTNGISIRDYIAIEAMKAMITASHFGCDPDVMLPLADIRFGAVISKKAYGYAEALIAESNKKTNA